MKPQKMLMLADLSEPQQYDTLLLEICLWNFRLVTEESTYKQLEIKPLMTKKPSAIDICEF